MARRTGNGNGNGNGNGGSSRPNPMAKVQEKLAHQMDALHGSQFFTSVFRPGSIFRKGYTDSPRNRSYVIMNSVLYHLHPVKVKRHSVKVSYTLCLGGLSFFLFILLTVTGIFLMFFYRPTAAAAWNDIATLETSVTFGLLVRNMHRWAAHLMVISVFLHMARVFYHGAYKPPREFNWIIGVILLLLTLLLSFTGYLLPWDQLALWAVTVGTNMIGYSPVVGSQVRFVLLGGVAIWVLVEAAQRWDEPPDVETGLMLAVAVVGAVANLGSLLVLRDGQRESLNVRGAYLEVLGDLVGSVLVIVAGITIATTGYARADALASVAIGLMILPRAWGLLRDVLDVLLEATPRGVDLDYVRDHIRSVPGVVDVHDLHAWTITSGVPVLSAHVVVDDDCIATGRSGEVLDRLGECLEGHFEVAHCTFQLEPVGHQEHEAAHHR